MRKKRRVVKNLSAARQRATAVANADDMTVRSKQAAIRKAFASVRVKRAAPVTVVNRRGGTVSHGPGKVRGGNQHRPTTTVMP